MQTRRARIAAKPLSSAIQPIVQSQPAASVADLQCMYDSLMQAIIAISARLDTLSTNVHAYTSAVIPLDTLAANVQQIVHQEVTTTPPPQALTIKTSPFQELPPELLQWMGRVEGLIVSLQEEVKILHLKATPDKSVEIGVSTPYVQTPPQTPSTPANKANKWGVYKSPDTLADTPEFRQCVADGMSKAELMKRFGVSESTVARAKRKLR